MLQISVTDGLLSSYAKLDAIETEIMSKNDSLVTAKVSTHWITPLEKINKTDYTITSIKKDSTDPSKTVVTYTPEDMFTKRDSIMISSSNSDPNIDGEYSIQPIRGGSVKINKEISKQGNYGIMKCYTSVSNQTTQIINDITKPVTTTVAGITGGVITDVVGDIIPSTLQSFGFGGLGNVPVFSWIACVLCIIILSMLLMLVIVI